MFDVLKTAHELGMDIVPRTTSFAKFVKLYDALCGAVSPCRWGIKLLNGGLDDWEIQRLLKAGLEVPRPDIAIGEGDPLGKIPLEVIKPKDPVFFLTRTESAEASFSLMLDREGATLEGVFGDALWRLRRWTPDFRITASGFEYGMVPEPLRRLWVKASMIEVPMNIIAVYEGWLRKNGEMEIYDVEIASARAREMGKRY